MFWDVFVKLCAERNTKPNPVARDLGLSNATTTRWKNGSIPNDVTLHKIADYFGVSVDYLLGKEPETKKSDDQEFRVALFGGDQEVTDDEWEEVKNFVEYLKAKRKKESK